MRSHREGDVIGRQLRKQSLIPCPARWFGDTQGNDKRLAMVTECGMPHIGYMGKITSRTNLTEPILVIRDMFTSLKMPQNLRGEDKFKEPGNGSSRSNRV